jgi:uncharacterized protein YaaR (DUF327 family)
MRIESKPFFSKSFLEKDDSVSKEDGSFIDSIRSIGEQEGLEPDWKNAGSDFNKLADLISKYGDNLSQNPTPENFNIYKKHIKLFISALQSNFEVHDTVSRINFSKQKIYKTVETIDSNLSEIARMILSNEKNRLSYLKLVNNIKGLLIDLIM